MSKIIELKAENVKVLKAIEIRPEGNIIELTGKNGNGKSSVLDSIIMALAGKKYQPEKPVRDGQDEANITLDIGKLIIKRKIKADGTSTVKVESKDGAIFKSPQALLDELFSNIGFDPLKFSGMKSKEQFEELKNILKIDFNFDQNEFERKKCYDERTMINREIKSIENSIELIKFPQDTPDQNIKMSDILEEINQINIFNAKQERIINEKSILENKIISLREQLKQEIERYKSMTEAEPKKDAEELKLKLNNAEVINNNVSLKLRKNELINKLKEFQINSNNLSNKIEQLDKEKIQAIQSVKMPVEGLSFGDGVVLYNGVPLEQCSQGEKIKISTSIAMSTEVNDNQLKVVLIKDGSLLDEDNMKLITNMALDKDYQVWIEKVDSTGKVGIVIEDGEIKSINK